MGKGVIDERLAQYIGTAALTSGDAIHEVINQADLILSIGHDTVEKPTNVITRSCKINKNNELDCENTTKVIHINFTPANLDRVYNPDLQVIGDIGNTLWQLCETDIS